MIGGYRHHISGPLIRCPLDHLRGVLPHVVVRLLRIGIANRLVAEHVRHGDLQPLLEARPLDEFVEPRLDVGELVDVDAGPGGRVGKYEDGDVSNRQTVSRYEGRSGLL